MKWILIALLAAVALIGAGVVLTGGEGGGSAVSGSPEAVLLCEEGTADYHAFRLNDAVDKLDKALELDPLLAEASIARALALHRLGRSDEVKAEVTRADSLTGLIENDERRMRAELRMSVFGLEHYRSMRDSLVAGLEEDSPNDIYVLEAKAMDAQRVGDEEEQERRWRQVLEVDPNNATAYNMLGYLELHRGNYEKSIKAMKKYAFMVPDQANPHDSMGEVLMVLGRYEDAEEAFKKSVQMQPDFYHSLINLAKTYLARGQIKKGTKIMGKVRAEVEGTELAKRIDREMVDFYLEAELEHELDAATAAFIADYPKDGTACFYRGVRLAYTKQFDQANAIMDSCFAAWRAEASYTARPKVRQEVDFYGHVFAGLVAEAANDPAAAIGAWREAIALVEDEWSFHEQWYPMAHLAHNLRAAERPQEALEVLDPIIAVNPRLFSVLEMATRSYLDLNDAELARRVLDQYKWCASKSDQDFVARTRAVELEEKVAALERAN